MVVRAVPDVPVSLATGPNQSLAAAVGAEDAIGRLETGP